MNESNKAKQLPAFIIWTKIVVQEVEPFTANGLQLPQRHHADDLIHLADQLIPGSRESGCLWFPPSRFWIDLGGILKRVLYSGLNEPREAPHRMIPGIAVSAVQNAQSDFLPLVQVHRKFVRLLWQNHRTLGLLDSIHQDLELYASMFPQIIKPNGRLES
jgi:hypothetical protein